MSVTSPASAAPAAWRVLPFSRAPAAVQLARTEALWQAVAAGQAPASLRWYGYDAPALVLGVGQDVSTIDAGAARAEGIAVVRRASGGTTVLADESMLALDAVLPAEHPRAGRDVLEAYRWLGEAFCAALVTLAPAGAERLQLASVAAARADQAEQRLAPEDTAASRRRLACFGTLSPYEVVLGAPPATGQPPRKLVGLSQIRKRGVVVFQAGVYQRLSGVRLAGLLALGDGQRAALGRELDRRIASLDELGLAAGALADLRRAVVSLASIQLPWGDRSRSLEGGDRSGAAGRPA